jgi:hypothetical protein
MFLSDFPTLLFISRWKEVVNFPWFGKSLKIFYRWHAQWLSGLFIFA